jgi:hypothetical protein
MRRASARATLYEGGMTGRLKGRLKGRLTRAVAAAALWLAALPAAAQMPPQRVPVGEPEARPQAQQPARAPSAQRQQRAGTPTEQLFDAINTGEIEDVRAAVAAGADVSARNLLGLTPVDLAIDLGRNDIALYLLSLGRARPLAPLPEEQAAGRHSRALERQLRLQQERAEQAAIEAALRNRAPAVSSEGIVAVAPLWRGDGGTPNPAIGFLGFDAGRPPGASSPAQRSAPAQQRERERPAAAPRAPVTREALPPG